MITTTINITTVYKVFVEVLFEIEAFRDSLWDNSSMLGKFSVGLLDNLHDTLEHLPIDSLLLEDKLNDYEFRK